MSHSADSKSPMKIPRRTTARPLSTRRPGDENFIQVGQSKPSSAEDAVTVAGSRLPSFSLGTILSIVAIAVAIVALVKSK